LARPPSNKSNRDGAARLPARGLLAKPAPRAARASQRDFCVQAKPGLRTRTRAAAAPSGSRAGGRVHPATTDLARQSHAQRSLKAPVTPAEPRLARPPSNKSNRDGAARLPARGLLAKPAPRAARASQRDFCVQAKPGLRTRTRAAAAPSGSRAGGRVHPATTDLARQSHAQRSLKAPVTPAEPRLARPPSNKSNRDGAARLPARGLLAKPAPRAARASQRDFCVQAKPGLRTRTRAAAAPSGSRAGGRVHPATTDLARQSHAQRSLKAPVTPAEPRLARPPSNKSNRDGAARLPARGLLAKPAPRAARASQRDFCVQAKPGLRTRTRAAAAPSGSRAGGRVHPATTDLARQSHAQRSLKAPVTPAEPSACLALRARRESAALCPRPPLRGRLCSFGGGTVSSSLLGLQLSLHLPGRLARPPSNKSNRDGAARLPARGLLAKPAPRAARASQRDFCVQAKPGLRTRTRAAAAPSGSRAGGRVHPATTDLARQSHAQRSLKAPVTPAEPRLARPPSNKSNRDGAARLPARGLLAKPAPRAARASQRDFCVQAKPGLRTRTRAAAAPSGSRAGGRVHPATTDLARQSHAQRSLKAPVTPAEPRLARPPSNKSNRDGAARLPARGLLAKPAPRAARASQRDFCVQAKPGLRTRTRAAAAPSGSRAGGRVHPATTDLARQSHAQRSLKAPVTPAEPSACLALRARRESAALAPPPAARAPLLLRGRDGPRVSLACSSLCTYLGVSPGDWNRLTPE
ncbi:nucleolar and coiled-body phosphoprotein 1-like, partial [Tiliqua scincoides]|uniref:nucleolar and coiled-body phosphoprotein 1-like n=1 Tax=Tiliqua scincoides TaxID=71010 RepID=UPI0034630D0A